MPSPELGVGHEAARLHYLSRWCRSRVAGRRPSGIRNQGGARRFSFAGERTEPCARPSRTSVLSGDARAGLGRGHHHLLMSDALPKGVSTDFPSWRASLHNPMSPRLLPRRRRPRSPPKLQLVRFLSSLWTRAIPLLLDL